MVEEKLWTERVKKTLDGLLGISPGYYSGIRRLLVRREPILLMEAEGESFTFPHMPKQFQQPLVTIRNVNYLEVKPSLESLPLHITPDDFTEQMVSFYNTLHSERDLLRCFMERIGLPFDKVETRGCYMSGRRSALCSDYREEKEGLQERLYRFKGITFRARAQYQLQQDGTFWIWGGEKYSNVLYERNMSQRFNLILREEGITPVMVYAGMWKYPQRVKGYRPAASIWEVQGDTRLDEFRTAVELHLEQRLKEAGRAGVKVQKALNSFYYQSGYVVGQLLNLMHRSGQSWSCDSDRTNAHPGNVVLYRIAKDRAALGLVDFDASCDSNDFSKDKLRKVQEKDLTDFVGWLYRPEPMSLPLPYLRFEVENGGRQSDPWEHLKIFPQGMATLEKGLLRGYQSKSRRLSTEIDLGPLWQEVMKARERQNLSD